MKETNEKEEGLKVRMTFDGYNLYPLYRWMLQHPEESKKLIVPYLKTITDYKRSVTTGGSHLSSKVLIVCGPPKELEKFLVLTLYVFRDHAPKKFGIDDLMIIKNFEDKEDSYYDSILAFQGLAVVYLHGSIITYKNMEEWNYQNIIQGIVSRQRSRLPEIILTEKPINHAQFQNSEEFIHINLYKNNNNSKTTNKVKTYKSVSETDYTDIAIQS